ncbi:MAG: Rieske (2Fe-2S) protein [Pseudomonadales bacterium]
MIDRPAGCYRRVLPVSLERLYENLLDWERLPYVHRTRCAAVACLDSGAWGWRASVTAVAGDAAMTGGEYLVEVRLDRRCRRWVTRITDAMGVLAEIRAEARPRADGQLEMTADFFVAAESPWDHLSAADRYAQLSAELYDADVAVMVERQRQLDRRIDGARHPSQPCDLGLRDTLALPLEFEFGGREFRLVEVDQRLRAFPLRCPHWLGPLGAGRLDGGVVTCPWHGYRFDVASGDNLSGGSCRLSHLPEVALTPDGRVLIVQEKTGQSGVNSAPPISG